MLKVNAFPLLEQEKHPQRHNDVTSKGELSVPSAVAMETGKTGLKDERPALIDRTTRL
jgi:hypothetical protein